MLMKNAAEWFVFHRTSSQTVVPNTEFWFLITNVFIQTVIYQNCAHGSPWVEIPCHTEFHFTATHRILISLLLVSKAKWHVIWYRDGTTTVSPKYQAPVIQWHGTISNKKGHKFIHYQMFQGSVKFTNEIIQHAKKCCQLPQCHSFRVYHMYYQWCHIFWYVRELNKAQYKYWSDFMVLHRYVYSSSSLTTPVKYNICTMRGLLALLIVGASFLLTPLEAQVNRWADLYLHCKCLPHKSPPRFQRVYIVFFFFFRHLTQLTAVSIRIAVHDQHFSVLALWNFLSETWCEQNSYVMELTYKK